MAFIYAVLLLCQDVSSLVWQITKYDNLHGMNQLPRGLTTGYQISQCFLCDLITFGASEISDQDYACQNK